MSRKLIAAAILALVVIFSGCTGNGGKNGIIEGYPGVAIVDFSPILNKVKLGSPVNFLLTVQNQGYYDAENVNVLLFNCGSVSKGTVDGNIYACNTNLFPNDFRLNKPDRELLIQGDLKEAEITLKTLDSTGKRLDFPQGRTPQTFTARVVYDYKTKGNIDVVFTTFENWRAQGGSIVTGPLSSFNEPAPLMLILNAPTEPIILPESGEIPEFTVGLSIRNTGGGFAHGRTMESIKLCYDPSFVFPAEEKGEHGDFGADIENRGSRECLVIDGTRRPENLRLIGQTNQYKDVDARFKNVAGSVQIQDTTNFDAEITYKYMLDRSATVTIENT